MSIPARLRERYRFGGVAGVVDGIRDFLHRDVTQGYTTRYQIDNVAEFWDANDDGYIPVQLPSYQLYVDPDDPGISTDILSRGIRDWPSYYHYRHVLRELPDNPLILEAGANIGYYALAAAVERPDAHVLCAELDEKNVELCRYNAEQNNLSGRLTIEQATLSDSAGTEKAVVTDESNLHSLQKTGDQTTTVETVTGDQFLEEHGHDPGDVDVLRMDVEGHELAILQGLTGLRPSVAHVEVHPPYLSANEWGELCEVFRRWDAEIVGVYKRDMELDINRVDGLPVNKSVQVVFADGG